MDRRTQWHKRPVKKSLIPDEIEQVLNHIRSLHIASRHEIGGGKADALVRLGLIEECWIGNYALTEAGEQVRQGKGMS